MTIPFITYTTFKHGGTLLLAIKINKCDHFVEILSVKNTKFVEEVFNDHHPGVSDVFEIWYTMAYM